MDQSHDAKQIIGFMVFAVAFGVLGHNKRHPSTVVGSAFTKGVASTAGDAKIILGGAIGATLLVLLAQAGEGPAAFAKGLAAVTLVSSILINGTEVFGAVSSITGTKSLPSPVKASTP